ncbi:hypothetical protein FB446DRAFT_638287 [Lentinula raphanica]|nr:hypothetical protein FB446DRAFT_638287 [Lentinula raphanica]
MLKNFEADAAAQELTNREKVRMVLKYIDSQTKSFWKTLEGYYENRDWEMIKKELLHAYLGLKKSHRYMKKSLKKIMEANVKCHVNSKEDISKYYQQFQNVSKMLKADRKLTEDNSNTHFWERVHKADRQKILQ